MKIAYSSGVVKSIPRIMSLIDRDSHSSTHGCCDRQYWHYKMMDFPNSRFQEACLTLALVYKNDYKGNIYKGSKKILETVLAAMKFWIKIQNKDGSFNEAMPNEHSFVATVFSSYAVSEALKTIDVDIENSERENIINSLEKVASWISENDDLVVTNHQAGAVTFLYNLYELTGKEKYKKLSEEKLKKLLETQTEEGWFPEYSGPDAGYLSLTIDFLSKYYKISKDESVLEPIEKAVQYLSYFVYPNGTFGGEIFSRNTELLFPAGLEIIANKIPIAKSIVHKNINSDTLRPEKMDDRYFVWMSYNFLQAHDNFEEKITTKLPFQEKFDRYFKDSGIFVRSDGKNYFVCNLKKGGVMKFFGKDFAYSDCGLVGKVNNSKVTNNVYDDYNINFTEDSISVSGNLSEIKEILPSPKKTIGLRLISSTPFRKTVKKNIIKKLITENKKTSIRFERKIKFSKKIEITDKVFLGKENIENLIIADKFSPGYTASSKFFQNQEIRTLPINTEPIEDNGVIIFKRTLRM